MKKEELEKELKLAEQDISELKRTNSDIVEAFQKKSREAVALARKNVSLEESVQYWKKFNNVLWVAICALTASTIFLLLEVFL